MSFGINGPENIPPIQKSHHTNDGGAGNLGYFQQKQKKKKKDENEGQDVFEFSSNRENESKEDPVMENLDSIGSRIKSWFAANNKYKKNPEV